MAQEDIISQLRCNLRCRILKEELLEEVSANLQQQEDWDDYLEELYDAERVDEEWARHAVYGSDHLRAVYGFEPTADTAAAVHYARVKSGYYS
jgi:hypothetical protein